MEARRPPRLGRGRRRRGHRPGARRRPRPRAHQPVAQGHPAGSVAGVRHLHRVGELVYGRVTKLVPFGSFVQVGEGIEGLVHISEMSAHHVDLPEQVVTPGEELWVKIIDLDLQRRRISLSIKQAAEGGVVAAEYQEHFGEHQYDDEGNYIGPALEHAEEAEAAWAEYYTEDPGRAAGAAADAGAAEPSEAAEARTGSRRQRNLIVTSRAAAVPESGLKVGLRFGRPCGRSNLREEVGVSSRRTLILIAAVARRRDRGLCAVRRTSAASRTRPTTTPSGCEIFKIVQDIPKGTFGDEAFAQGFIEQDEIAEEYRPATAITDAVADRRPGRHLRPGRQPGGRRRTSSSPSRTRLSTLLAAPEEQRGGHHDLGRPGPRRGRPARARRLREHPRHRRSAGARRRPAGGGAAAAPASTPSRPATCTRRCRSSPSGRPASSSPARRRPPTPTAPRPPPRSSGLITFVVPAEAAQRIASVAGGEHLPDARRQGLPARRPSARSTSNAPLPGETGSELTPYGPEGRPES